MERGRLQLGVVLLGGLWLQTAQAQTLVDHLGETRSALVDKDKRAAKRSLEGAEDEILGAEDVVPGVHVARYWYFLGMEHHQRRKTSRAMDAWRNALVVDPRFEWDIDLMEDRDTRRLFEALRGEILGRPEVDAQVPDKVGVATLWVDGTRVRTEDVVRQGEHLLQVVCPDKTVHARWSDLPEAKLSWLSLCPEGVDTSVVVAESVDDSDGFDDLAPDFGDGPDEPAAGPVVVVEESPDEEVAVEESPDEEVAVEESPDKEVAVELVPDEEVAVELVPDEEVAVELVPDKEVVEVSESPSAGAGFLARGTPRIYAMAAGGGMIVGGLVSNFAVVEPVWAQIDDARDNPSDYSRAQAEWLTNRFNTFRAVSLGLISGGVVVAGAGYVFLEAPVQPMIHPGGAGIIGRW